MPEQRIEEFQDSRPEERFNDRRIDKPPDSGSLVGAIEFWADTIIGVAFFSTLWPLVFGLILLVDGVATSQFDVRDILGGFVCVFLSIPVFGAMSLPVTAGIASMLVLLDTILLNHSQRSGQTIVRASWIGGLTGLICAIPLTPDSNTSFVAVLWVLAMGTPLCQAGGIFGAYQSAKVRIRHEVETPTATSRVHFSIKTLMYLTALASIILATLKLAGYLHTNLLYVVLVWMAVQAVAISIASRLQRRIQQLEMCRHG